MDIKTIGAAFVTIVILVVFMGLLPFLMDSDFKFFKIRRKSNFSDLEARVKHLEWYYKNASLLEPGYRLRIDKLWDIVCPEPKKFKRKPESTVVEAIQFDGKNFDAVDRFIGDKANFRKVYSGNHQVYEIDTNLGDTTAYKGDWIICEADGGIFINTSDELKKKYEPLDCSEKRRLEVGFHGFK